MKLITWPYYSAEYLRTQGLSETFVERFWSKVHITETCWLWTGARHEFGYGRIGRGGRGHGAIRAHVASWLLHYGLILEGLYVLHDCPGGDTPACINPAHLWLGTIADNNADMTAKGRRRNDPPKGEQCVTSKLTAAEIAVIRAIPITYGMKSELARRFHISYTQMCRILANQSWKHVYD